MTDVASTFCVSKLRHLRKLHKRFLEFLLQICQANGRPIMTEHLNKRFKEILAEMNDPEINLDDMVFHSIRHTSAGVKLRLSKGDLKAVQGDGGWNTPDMVTKRYAHILDEDRKKLAADMEASFYKKKEAPNENKLPDAADLAALLTSNPELLMKIVQSIQTANTD